MAVKNEKELNETQRALWLKTLAAMELRNFGYAISLLQGILKQEPEFLTGRQLLRRAEVTKQKTEKKSFFNISTRSEEHTSELQSLAYLVCRLLLEKKKKTS